MWPGGDDRTPNTREKLLLPWASPTPPPWKPSTTGTRWNVRASERNKSWASLSWDLLPRTDHKANPGLSIPASLNTACWHRLAVGGRPLREVPFLSPKAQAPPQLWTCKDPQWPLRLADTWHHQSHLCWAPRLQAGQGRSPLLVFLLCINGKVKVLVVQSCATLWEPIDCTWDSPGKNTGVGSHSLLQGIFLTQGSDPGLLHCRQILYCLSHTGDKKFEIKVHTMQLWISIFFKLAICSQLFLLYLLGKLNIKPRMLLLIPNTPSIETQLEFPTIYFFSFYSNSLVPRNIQLARSGWGGPKLPQAGQLHRTHLETHTLVPPKTTLLKMGAGAGSGPPR